jgi:hypothetical protein
VVLPDGPGDDGDRDPSESSWLVILFARPAAIEQLLLGFVFQL